MFDPGSLSLPDSAEPHRASGRGEPREGRWETAISCDLRRSFGIDSETVDGEGPNIDGVEIRPIVREVSVASTKPPGPPVTPATAWSSVSRDRVVEIVPLPLFVMKAKRSLLVMTVQQTSDWVSPTVPLIVL